MKKRVNFATILSRILTALYAEKAILDDAIRAIELLERFRAHQTWPNSAGIRSNRANLRPLPKGARIRLVLPAESQ
jgi:hypothetical protein